MPLRIKCRCGQDLVLRYSEWVYVLVGLSIVGFVANLLVIIALLARVSRLEDDLAALPSAREDTNIVERDADPTKRTKRAPRGGREKGGREKGDREKTERQKTRREPRESSEKTRIAKKGATTREPTDAEEIDPREAARQRLIDRRRRRDMSEDVGVDDSDTEIAHKTAHKTAPPWRASNDLRPLGSPSTGDPNDDKTRAELLAEIERQLRSEPDDPDRSGGGGTESTGDAAADALTPQTRQLVDAAPLTRLMLLEESTSFSSITAGFLLDPELRIARRAATLLATKARPNSNERRAIGPLVALGIRRLAGFPEGETLANHLSPIDTSLPGAGLPDAGLPGAGLPGAGLPGAGLPGAGLPDAAALDKAWDGAKTLCAGMTERLALTARIDRFLNVADSNGSDVLLAVDTTRSMGAGLGDLKETLAWLLPALEWGAPNVRVGLLLYKDEIVGVEDLTSNSAERILPKVLDLEAEGGGDVPEGVDTAVRAALELGRFSWRENASKHVLIIGDAPPRYAALRELESLLAASHSEGGFRVHLFGVYPKEGDAVPFFEKLAKKGGGRSPTCRAGELETELLFSLLGEESPTTVRRFQERVKDEFARGL